MQVTTQWLTDLATLAGAAGGPFHTLAAIIGCFTAITDRGADTDYADLTFSTDTGMALFNIVTWTGPFSQLDGSQAMDGGLTEFNLADVDNAATFLGWALVKNSGSLLWAYEYFPQPIALSTVTQVIGIVPRITLPQDARWSATMTFNG